MFGMRERITSEDIKTLHDWFHEVPLADSEFNDEMLRLLKKIDLYVRQDEISSDAGKKINELQDEIFALYKKDEEKKDGE